MTRPARSVFVFGIYLALLGATLTVVPNILLAIFGFPETNEVWIRIVGVLAFLMGYIYVQAARNNLKEIFVATAYARCGVFVSLVMFVVLGYAIPMLILFGLADLCGALWTMKEIHREGAL